MRADLLEAQANIDWVMSQLPNMSVRFEAWLNQSVAIEIRETPQPDAANVIVGVEKELLPLSFHVEVGAYINAIRSSLDILAVALVKRYQIDIDEEEVYFPIWKSEEAFRKPNTRGAKLIQALPALEQKIMKELRPYQGGNQFLWTLHRLDIVRKHHRLLNVAIRPIHITLQGTLNDGDFTPLATESFQVNEETVLGLIRKGVKPALVRSKFYIGIHEPGLVERKPAFAVIGHLATQTSGVVALFDG